MKRTIYGLLILLTLNGCATSFDGRHFPITKNMAEARERSASRKEWVGSEDGGRLDKLPVLAGVPAHPIYPIKAQEEKIYEGYVIFKMHIDEFGKVSQVDIEEAKPVGVFETAVSDAAKKWRFYPAIRGGKPVKSWMRYFVTLNTVCCS